MIGALCKAQSKGAEAGGGVHVSACLCLHARVACTSVGVCVCVHTCVWRVCTQGGQEGIVRRVVSGQSLREEGWPAGGRWTGICTKNFLDGEKPGGPVVFRELGGLHGQESKGEPLPAPAKGSGKA